MGLAVLSREPHMACGAFSFRFLFPLFRSGPMLSGLAKSHMRSETNTLSHLV